MSPDRRSRRARALAVVVVFVVAAVVLATGRGAPPEVVAASPIVPRPSPIPMATPTATPTPSSAPTPSPSPVASPSPSPPPAPSPTPLPPPAPAPEPAWISVLDPAGEPARVVIPAIGVDADLVRLGLRADRSMEVPDFGHAGWYAEGPPPGHPGPSVVAAHVDSRAGPDVFARLGDLRSGDLVHVVYDSGEAVTFEVDTKEQVPKDRLPGDSIWPVTDQRRLTLITCGGEFDRGVRHYRDNVIVYTHPLSS